MMSIKQADKFLKKVGKRKNVSKFEIYKEDIIYLYNEGATFEIITQYLETKGIKRTKGYSTLSSFVKRNISLKSSNQTQKNITNYEMEKDKSTPVSIGKNIDPRLMDKLLNKNIEL